MKIKRIHISNYRAFLVNEDQGEATRYAIELPNGENLLIYGENGSGKSSLFRALKDFFSAASDNGQPFQKNLFYDEEENTEAPFIDIVTSDNCRHRFSADGNQYILAENPQANDTNYITHVNSINGFISYRDLLKLHFRPDNQEPDLAALFLGKEGLFSEMDVPAPANPDNKGTFKALWEKCLQGNENAITDYNTNVPALFDDLETKANRLLAFFEKDCLLKINYTETKLLSEGGQPIVISTPVISFKVTLFGQEIPDHNDVLNEARLTAMAISVFLAHQLCRPITDLKVLFLDDIFIGLDMTNRIPLLKILTADDLGDGSSFKDFQIFLTTYDREWFHIAQTHLDNGWKKAELYVDDHSHITPRPLIGRSDTYRERAEYHLTKGDYPACANYLRKAFEQSLRKILPENTLYPGFNSTSGDNSIIALSKRNLSFSENDNAWFYKLKNEEDVTIETFRFITLQQLIDQFKKLINQYKIPFLFIEELTGIKNRLLNPLSHDDLRSAIFRSELIAGLKIWDELQKFESRNILSIDNTVPVQLYCTRKDYKGDTYCYRFELMENLRYIEYGTFKTFLNAHIRSQYRAKEHKNFEVMERDYTSLRKLCESIFFLSDLPGGPSGFYEDFMFDDIYTDENRKLSELI